MLNTGEFPELTAGQEPQAPSIAEASEATRPSPAGAKAMPKADMPNPESPEAAEHAPKPAGHAAADPDPAAEQEPESIRDALRMGFTAIGDLHVVECALRAAADEDNPLDDETRMVVLHHATRLLRERIRALDAAFDFLDDQFPC